MSLRRLVYYSAVIGGWAALCGWAVAELLFIRGGSAGLLAVALTAALVGAGIGGGLNAVAGLANPQWARLLRRAGLGAAGGAAGGLVGGLLGEGFFQLLSLLPLPSAPVLDTLRLMVAYALGWMLVGLGIGAVDGLSEGSRKKLRNGLLGGGLGGLLGGGLFHPIVLGLASESGMAARATAFVILGVAIGALIGLAQLVFKEAWLTVVDGFRPGRQLILSQPVTPLGRGDHLPMPLLGYAARDIETEHARITRRPDGGYTIEDAGSRLGTRVNNRLIAGPVALADGDLIKLGSNILRFNVRQGRSAQVAVAVPVASAAGGGISPPPPPPGSAAAPVVSPTAPVAGPPPTPGVLPPGAIAPRPASPPLAQPVRPQSSSGGGRIPPPPPPPTIPRQ
jgi:hypothetical protein